MTCASKVSVNTMKCIRPFVLIADIAFTGNRLPVRRTTGVQPLAPVVHGRERDLEHRGNILTVRARRQRGHRPQPKGILRRQRQQPCVPHQFTHTRINDPEHLPFQNTYRFGSNRGARDGFAVLARSL
jgi:hypothetical protein